MVLEGESVESDVTEQNSEWFFKTLDQIQETSSSIYDFSIQFDDVSDSLEEEDEERLRVVKVREKEIGLIEESISRRLSVLEEKEIEFDLRQVFEATIMMLVLEKQSEEAENNKLGLLLDSTSKKLIDLMSEFEGKKEEARQISESILEKLCELEKAKKDFDLKRRYETERQNKESEAREKKLRALEEAIKEKSAELKRKEETFELKQKEEAEKLREETELRRNGLEIKEKALEKMFKEIELKQMELEERSKQQLIEEESRKRSKLESEVREKELNSLKEAIKEKSTELNRKEDTFELKLKEAENLREETDLKRKGLDIKEKALEKMLNELELKQMELEERLKQQFREAESRKRSNLELETPLLVNIDSDAASITRQAKKHKSQEANDGEIEEIVCKSEEDPISLNCPDTKFNDFSESMSSFVVDQVWALYDPRDDMPRIYAQIREIFSSQLSLQVTLLEPVKTTKNEKSILSACGRFEYGDTEIKSHLMFAHEMNHITCVENVIVNPRKGETWALFRDWNTSWNSHPDLYEPPYRYDFVEVISEFDDLIGIPVAYMGMVEGFASVFTYAEQHGLIKIVISPGEMQRFSHKVASVKLSGDEQEGIPAGSFKLNFAATPNYKPVLEEAVKMEIQSKDCGKAPTVVDENC